MRRRHGPAYYSPYHGRHSRYVMRYPHTFRGYFPPPYIYYGYSSAVSKPTYSTSLIGKLLIRHNEPIPRNMDRRFYVHESELPSYHIILGPYQYPSNYDPLRLIIYITSSGHVQDVMYG